MTNTKQLLIAILIVAALCLLLFVWTAFSNYLKRKKQVSSVQKPRQPSQYVISSRDIRAVSGEDIFSTQLDLARAYLEMGKRQLAQKILQHTLTHGNEQQQEEARRLLQIFT